MTETSVKVRATCSKLSSAKKIASKLKSASLRFDQNLYRVLNSIEPIDATQVEDQLQIDSVNRSKSEIIIEAYTGRNLDPPVWIVSPLARLGSDLTSIVERFDEGTRGTYFAGWKQIPQSSYDSKRKKELGLKTSSKSDKLYMPKGRVEVSVTKIDFSVLIGQDYGMKMLTEDGITIYFVGESDRLEMCAKIKKDKKIKFTAEFTKKLHKGKYVPCVKNLSDIQAVLI